MSAYKIFRAKFPAKMRKAIEEVFGVAKWHWNNLDYSCIGVADEDSEFVFVSLFSIKIPMVWHKWFVQRRVPD
jgi:hypothetical protein